MDWYTLPDIIQATRLSESAIRRKIARYLKDTPERNIAPYKRNTRAAGGYIMQYSQQFCIDVFGAQFKAPERTIAPDDTNAIAQQSETPERKYKLIEAKYRHLLNIAALQAKEIANLKEQRQDAKEQVHFLQALVERNQQQIERQQQQLAAYQVKTMQVEQAKPMPQPLPMAVYIAGGLVVLMAILLVLYLIYL